MSAAAQTRIFGMRIGLDPKLIVAGLVVVAVALYWFNSRNSESASPAVTNPQTTAATPAAAPRARPLAARRVNRNAVNSNNRGTLRLEAVDATHGDIDPTLRLDLLARLKTVDPGASGRNLFEVGAEPVPATPIPHPTIPIKPKPGSGGPGGAVATGPAPEPPLNIPLKFYGFVRPVGKGVPNQGFFLDGDIVLVASEGEVLKGHYLIVELTPNSARIEDTQLKKSQNIPVVPEAREDM